MFIIIAALISSSVVFGSPVSKDPYIFGGQNATAKEFPFAVALVDKNADLVNSTSFCSGSILTKDWILTAAQCCFNRDGKDVKVIAGTNDLAKGGKSLAVNKTIVHPFFEYKPSADIIHPNDVCLMLLKNSLNFTEKIQPAAIPPADYPFADKTPVSVLGWGSESTSWGGDAPSSNKLQVFRSLLAYPSVCPSFKSGEFVGQFCAESTYIGHSPCKNDEGAPLIFYGSQRPVQIGIFSFIKEKYCSKNQLSNYGRVAHYVPWIQATIGESALELTIADYKELPCRFEYCSPW